MSALSNGITKARVVIGRYHDKCEPRNSGTATRWLQAAADDGELSGMFHLAKLLNSRRYNLDAEVWFRKAAELGYPQAQCELGELLLKSSLLQAVQDKFKAVPEALEWHRKAAVKLRRCSVRRLQQYHNADSVLGVVLSKYLSIIDPSITYVETWWSPMAHILWVEEIDVYSTDFESRALDKLLEYHPLEVELVLQCRKSFRARISLMNNTLPLPIAELVTFHFATLRVN